MRSHFSRTWKKDCILCRPKVESCLALDLPLRAIASNLNISTGTAHVFKRFEDTGEVDPKPAPKRKELRKLDDHHELYIVGLVLANPTVQLSEMCSKVHKISGTVVSINTASITWKVWIYKHCY